MGTEARGLLTAGAAVAINEIDSVTRAYLGAVDDGDLATADVEAASLEVLASSSATILAAAIGATGGRSNAFGGSATVNRIRSRVDAFGRNADLTTSGPVSVDADNDAVVRTLAGGAAISVPDEGLVGRAAVGAGVSVNDVVGRVHAYLADSTVTTSGGDLTVAADAEATIRALAAGGALGQGLVLGGSFTLNQIHHEVDAHLLDTPDGPGVRCARRLRR